MHEVYIDGLGAAGDGVGRLDDGQVIFVPGALPGDRVRIRVGARRKRVQHAELLEVVTASAERIVGRCRVERCGGCALKNFSNTGQSESKRSRIVETLRRVGHVDVEKLLAPVSQVGDGWGYRHRVRLHAAWSGKRWEVGYHGRRSNSVIDFSTCPVLEPKLEEVAAAVTERLGTLERSARLEEVVLAYSLRDDRVAMRLTGKGPMRPYRHIVDWLEEAGVAGIEVETADARWRFGNLELRYDHARAEDFDLRFEPGVFTQAHPLANDRLVDAVINAVRPRQAPRVLELHSGIGNFSLPLSRAGAHVTAVEHNLRATILARRNARRAGAKIDARDISDDQAVASGLSEHDVVLMDPPRVGAVQVAHALAERGPPRVVYVSCDPATLARDVAIMVGGGYALRHCEAFDLFPQTPHVEALVVLERA